MSGAAFKLAEDYFPLVPRKEGQRCELKFHYRRGSVIRQVVSVVCFLADRNSQRLVFASDEGIRKMCFHYREGARDKNPSLRSVRYALALLRKQGIISERTVKLGLSWRNGDPHVKTREYRQYGGRPKKGFVVIEHDHLAKYDDAEEGCALSRTGMVAISGACWDVNPNAVF